MSRGMIHNKHIRMDHRLSVPHSTQPLGLYADNFKICCVSGPVWLISVQCTVMFLQASPTKVCTRYCNLMIKWGLGYRINSWLVYKQIFDRPWHSRINNSENSCDGIVPEWDWTTVLQVTCLVLYQLSYRRYVIARNFLHIYPWAV